MGKDESKNWWRPSIVVFSEVSTWIAGPIILALIIGKELDKHYGTYPVLFLIFAGVGFLISSYGIIKAVKRFNKKINGKKE